MLRFCCNLCLNSDDSSWILAPVIDKDSGKWYIDYITRSVQMVSLCSIATHAHKHTHRQLWWQSCHIGCWLRSWLSQASIQLETCE